MRRSDHPSRPNARTCCCLLSPKTLLMAAREHAFLAGVNVSAAYAWWPVFRCPSMAGFGRPPRVSRPPRNARADAEAVAILVRTHSIVVTLTSASWNQIREWFKLLEALRQLA